MKMQYQKYQKIQFYIQSYIDIWEIILYLQANPYQLKTKNINILIFINILIKLLTLFYRIVFFKKEKDLFVIYRYFSTELLFKLKI